MAAAANGNGEKKGLRLWADGCFDMVHFGHANALRQAKQLGDYLIVGVHTDAAITANKGPPVFSEEERYKMVGAIKWVDEVAKGSPFVTSLEWMDRFGADICCHGDDIILAADGDDCYGLVKAAGRFKTFPRTQGVSTTALVGRMLLATKSHFELKSPEETTDKETVELLSKDASTTSPYTGASVFVASTGLIAKFTQGRERRPEEKCVYVTGSFDLFHPGHLAFLESCQRLGSYVILGIHADKVVNEYKGGNYPIMNLHERVLTALAYKPVAEVVIGAPYIISADFLEHFKVDYVAHGSNTPEVASPDGTDPYAIAKERGIFTPVDSGCDMTTDMMIQRIIDNRAKYIDRNAKKEKREVAQIAGRGLSQATQ